ncbi:hypothetical protein CW895_12335 [Listeria monocytogenes]|uniref:Uncharacterized protein n=1 Tax=Listeria monocytogenes TaxID=1639 RepID=A0A823IZ12_LISMN|nr:hypothetical protein [Listeria monocytogenes]
MENARERKRMYEKEIGEIQTKIDKCVTAIEQETYVDEIMKYIGVLDQLRALIVIKFEGLAIASDEIINELEEKLK